MVGTTVCVGGLTLMALAAILAGLVWLYRLGWGQIEEDDFSDDLDDGEEVVVEIIDEE